MAVVSIEDKEDDKKAAEHSAEGTNSDKGIDKERSKKTG